MKVGDLFLGDVEGKKEFSDKERIDKLYFLGLDKGTIGRLVDGDKRYIHGYKGTGKTSLLKVLECNCRERGIPYISLSYTKVREDAETVYELRRRFNELKESLEAEEDKETMTSTFWKWYILSLVAREFLNVSPDHLIYSTKQRLFRRLAAVVDMLVITVDQLGNLGLGLKMGSIANAEENEDIGKAAQNIRVLSSEIAQRLEKKVVIFIDELELTKARSTYGLDRVMIKGLLLATRHINELSQHLHVVVAVRDEVMYAVSGDEINKLRDDFGVELTWWTRREVTVDHSLWRLMFKKIRYSMRDEENPDALSDLELWNRWFPFSIDNKPTWKHFFNLTWARPRDFVRLLNLMQNHCREKKAFTRESYDLALGEYSKRQLSEISEEISTLFDDEITKRVKAIIQQLGLNFSYAEFFDEARRYGLPDPATTLAEMYRVGFVGNHAARIPSRWRFFYRNDEIPNLSLPFEVHRALHEALGIKDKFNRSLFYS
jgi:hypothetical protein